MENVMKGTLLSRVCSFAVCRNNTTGKAHFKEVSNHLDIPSYFTRLLDTLKGSTIMNKQVQFWTKSTPCLADSSKTPLPCSGSSGRGKCSAQFATIFHSLLPTLHCYWVTQRWNNSWCYSPLEAELGGMENRLVITVTTWHRSAKPGWLQSYCAQQKLLCVLIYVHIHTWIVLH